MNQISKKFTWLELIKFSLPPVAMMLLTSLYTAVDGIFVSQFVGSDALSSINIILPLDGIICGIGIMLGTGASAVIGLFLGEKKDKKAKESFSLVTFAGILIGGIMSVSLLTFLPEIVRFLGASDKLYPYCMDYARIMFLFAIPYILQVMFNSLFVTAGKPSLALKVSIICGLSNLVLDYLFIVVCNMGISGAAWGTVLSRLFGGIFPIYYFLKHKEGLCFEKTNWNWKILNAALSNGSSEMVSNIAAGVTTFLFNITMMKLLGEDGVAAMTIVLYTQFIFTAVFFGFSNSAAPVISYNYGSNDTTYLKKLMKYCLTIIGACTVAMMGGAILFAKPVIALFTSPGSSVYELAYSGYILFIWNFIFAGFNIFTSSMFTALSNGFISALLSFLRTFIFIVGFALTLPRFFGVDGLWLSVPAAELLAAILAVILIIRHRKVYHYY